MTTSPVAEYAALETIDLVLFEELRVDIRSKWHPSGLAWIATEDMFQQNSTVDDESADGVEVAGQEPESYGALRPGGEPFSESLTISNVPCSVAKTAASCNQSFHLRTNMLQAVLKNVRDTYVKKKGQLEDQMANNKCRGAGLRRMVRFCNVADEDDYDVIADDIESVASSAEVIISFQTVDLKSFHCVQFRTPRIKGVGQHRRKSSNVVENLFIALKGLEEVRDKYNTADTTVTIIDSNSVFLCEIHKMAEVKAQCVASSASAPLERYKGQNVTLQRLGSRRCSRTRFSLIICLPSKAMFKPLHQTLGSAHVFKSAEGFSANDLQKSGRLQHSHIPLIDLRTSELAFFYPFISLPTPWTTDVGNIRAGKKFFLNCDILGDGAPRIQQRYQRQPCYQGPRPRVGEGVLGELRGIPGEQRIREWRPEGRIGQTWNRIQRRVSASVGERKAQRQLVLSRQSDELRNGENVVARAESSPKSCLLAWLSFVQRSASRIQDHSSEQLVDHGRQADRVIVANVVLVSPFVQQNSPASLPLR
ncbi:unnamed protein product [Heligmosomoides polygyrus]|uniref:DDE_Tnp_1_7 domain-containing protein n=1 Tax=Heligmosomoides polygyrus TaxID=6339 RepID=A0A3P8A2M8_HELPZ|nr:unnamed protein product [Heligmosomoides polygyrus]